MSKKTKIKKAIVKKTVRSRFDRRVILIGAALIGTAIIALSIGTQVDDTRQTAEVRVTNSLNAGASSAHGELAEQSIAKNPDFQRALKSQIVAAAKRAVREQMHGDQVHQHVEAGAGDREALEDLIKRLLDPTATLDDRRRAAWELTSMDSDEALAALKEALPDAPSYLKAAIAEGLGRSPHPDARPLILEILDDPDAAAARGAIRGLARIGDVEAIGTLHDVLVMEGRGLSVRGEAARSMGDIDHPDAYTGLVDAFQLYGADDAPEANPDMADDILAGLGRRDIDETSEFYTGILDTPGADENLRATAMDSLEEARGDVGPFLVEYLDDPNPDVRAAAAWGLASTDNPGAVSDAVFDALTWEDDGHVRKRLYQALTNQEYVETDSIVPLVLAESDTQARLAGAYFLATQVRSESETNAREHFDAALVPELQTAALQLQDLGARIDAVRALKRAGTPAARDALAAVAELSSDERIVIAARGLPKRK